MLTGPGIGNPTIGWEEYPLSQERNGSLDPIAHNAKNRMYKSSTKPKPGDGFNMFKPFENMLVKLDCFRRSR